MGDGADMALEESLDYEEEVLEYQLGRISDTEAYEQGLIGELGGLLRAATWTLGIKLIKLSKREKSKGPGPCPKCGEKTELKDGQFGKFYGCVAFPECKGNRNYK